jgi:hypothetical protein
MTFIAFLLHEAQAMAIFCGIDGWGHITMPVHSLVLFPLRV